MFNNLNTNVGIYTDNISSIRGKVKRLCMHMSYCEYIDKDAIKLKSSLTQPSHFFLVFFLSNLQI